jgi:hypothetical protein
MSSGVLPYSLSTLHMSIACIVSSGVSLVILLQVLVTFIAFRNRVDCCFNRFIMIFCALQTIQCLQKTFFAGMTIVNDGLPFLACDINASLDQFLDFTSICFLIAFFVGMSNARAYWESSWNGIAYVAAPLLGAVSLATIWALLADRKPGVSYDTAPYFSQDLAWCWIPSHVPQDLALIKSSDALRDVQMFIGYLPTVLTVVTALYAYVNQRCRTGESWLGKGVVLRRFLGTSIFPVVIYIIGMPIRISFASQANTVAIVISAVYPLTGGIIGIVFLWTEGALSWVPRLLLRRLCCRGGRSRVTADDEVEPSHDKVDGESCPESVANDDESAGRQYADVLASPSPHGQRSSLNSTATSLPSTPKRSGLSQGGVKDSWLHSEEAVPNSFTATLRAMMCDAVIGQHVASSRPAYYTVHGRIISDRQSVIDSTTSTETNFGRNTTATQHYEFYGEQFSSYQIHIDPASRRSDHGDRNNNDINRESSLFSLREMNTDARFSNASSAQGSNATFTTRSELSLPFISPHVRIHASGESPSAAVLLAYRSPSAPRVSAQLLREDEALPNADRRVVDGCGFVSQVE